MRQVPRTEVQAHHWPILEPLTENLERPVALNKQVCVAGDRSRVNLSLHSDQISRAHAIFLWDEQGIYLRDLASLSHVFVNDQQVRETDVHDGDLLKIGPFEFRCNAPAAENADNGVGHAPAAELRTPDGSIHVPMTSRTILLGSREDCDVIMSGDSVAPAHAVIFELDAKHHIRHLCSRGGTFVNDKQIGQTELKTGDSVRVGDSTLEYHCTMTDAAQKGAQPTVPPDDLGVIPLAEDPQELQSIAAEFAKEREAQAEEPDSPSGDLSLDDSGIIPLLDDSQSAPGLPEPDIGLHKEIALADEGKFRSAAPGSKVPAKRDNAPRDNNPDREPANRSRSKQHSS